MTDDADGNGNSTVPRNAYAVATSVVTVVLASVYAYLVAAGHQPPNEFSLLVAALVCHVSGIGVGSLVQAAKR